MVIGPPMGLLFKSGPCGVGKISAFQGTNGNNRGLHVLACVNHVIKVYTREHWQPSRVHNYDPSRQSHGGPHSMFFYPFGLAHLMIILKTFPIYLKLWEFDFFFFSFSTVHVILLSLASQCEQTHRFIHNAWCPNCLFWWLIQFWSSPTWEIIFTLF